MVVFLRKIGDELEFFEFDGNLLNLKIENIINPLLIFRICAVGSYEPN